MAENPFKLEQRNYPVDYGYPRNKMYVLSLTLPDGYEVEQLPSSVHYCTQDKSGVFKYKAVHSGNAIQIMYQMSIKKPLFLQNEYDELRSFYNLIVSKESEPVIIKEAQP